MKSFIIVIMVFTASDTKRYTFVESFKNLSSCERFTETVKSNMHNQLILRIPDFKTVIVGCSEPIQSETKSVNQ